jgi:type VI secretion system secreted protein VgrG
MAKTQAQREIELITPLGADVLLFRQMNAFEELGRLFTYELEMLSEDSSIQAEDLLGQNVAVRINLSGGGERYFNGYVTRFAHTGHFEHVSTYRATVRPWAWFLTRTTDCRIFQDRAVPDIIKEVLRENGYTDFEDRLSRSYRTWGYCVQYRETDFDFLSRLMEQEGIYYFFSHERSKHTLVLCDEVSALQTVPGYEEIPFYPRDSTAVRSEEYIYEWSVVKQIEPGAYVLEEYDFEKPKAELRVQRTMPKSHAEADREIFDYPGEYLSVGEGDDYVRTRIEEIQAEYEQTQAQGNTRGLFPGGLFKLRNNPREDQNREYLTIAATHSMALDPYASYGPGYSGGAPVYAGSYSAVSSSVTYRSASITPKPIVKGPQTAVVVGPEGEEIYTDKLGRVKVQFHWDRYGRANENSSCWIRVSSTWAGHHWGAIALPRIGQEVIVDFLEGDPDRPIITGRVYNAKETPPYELPANATQSGVKSRSSKQGTNKDFNELRFEDKKGEEEIYFHAERDFNRVVENNDSLKVGFEDRDPGNQSIQIHGSQSVSIGGDQSKSIGNNQTVTIGGPRAGDGSQTVEIWKDRNVTLKTGDDELTVELGNQAITIQLGDHSLSLPAGKSTTKATKSIEFRVGASSIKLEPGSIIIRSPQIKIDGTATVDVASAMTTVQGSGMLTLQGGLVKINC